MKLFKKKEPQMIEVKGHILVCPICSNKLFRTRSTFVSQVFGTGWTRCFICSECTYIYWFWS
jgi:uncharacterized protein with PIN domain